MQTTILQMFKRKERDEETQNVLKIRKTTPTDDTVEARGRKRRLSQKKWQQVPQKPPQVMLALLHTLLYGKKNNMNSSNRKMNGCMLTMEG
ncbi:hypothetical protein F7725_012062 [Dissostichus mawsoni]|uniref:Uncharacterized protein n=1 Tax=Dissostichus mawsoni TaxID=36200 RepID=A0A7J5ZCI9_DISMA|nr:hypothetical protein F7725_012062 [Dissostichus mawsoni]